MNVSNEVERYGRDSHSVQVVLDEDSPTDGELWIRALRKMNPGSDLFRAKDGAEALDFIFEAAPPPARKPCR